MKRFLVSAAVVLLGLAVSFGCGTVQKVPLDPGLAVVALGFLISEVLGIAAPTPRAPAADPTAEDSPLATAA